VSRKIIGFKWEVMAGGLRQNIPRSLLFLNFILTFKIMYLNAWEGHYDRNMYHILTSVIKFAVLGGSTYVIFSICNLYCVLNIIKEITRIRMRSGRDNIFCRNLNRIGLMGGISGNINFTKVLQ
jgi:hypothetical protein